LAEGAPPQNFRLIYSIFREICKNDMNVSKAVRAFGALLGYLTQDCCQGRPEICSDLAPFAEALLAPLEGSAA
jgi:hypothetical protein